MKPILLVIGLLCAAQSVAAQEGDGPRVRYKVGEGLQIASEDGANQIALQGRVQTRFTLNGLEQAEDTDTFAVQRGKIKLDGHVLDRLIRVGFQMNLATRANAATTAVCTNAACTTTANAVTTESTTGLASLEDYWIDWVPGDVFGVKMGQFKVPFLIQELTSSGKQQFVDRSLSTGFFNLGRDLGVTLHGNFWERGLNYSLFIMNGEGINTVNRNKGFLTGLRLELPILGTYKYSESDTDQSEEQNLGIGAAYAYNERGNAFGNNTIAAFTKASHATFDLGYKHRGFSFQGAGMLSQTHEGAKFKNLGYNAQAGYFFVPKKFEVAVKTGGTVFETAPNPFEYALALNYFIAGHGIKLQSDYTLLMNSRGQDLNDHQFRTQMQVIF